MSLCMKSLNKTTESKYVSPDEPMLKELERRDGIYSFIFHELEARKPEICPATVLAVSAAPTTTTVTTTNASDCQFKSVPTLPLLATTLLPSAPAPALAPAPAPASATKKEPTCKLTTTTMTNDLSANFKKPANKLMPFQTAFSNCAFVKNELPAVTTVTCSSPSSSTEATRTQNVRDCRTLYAYLPKCRVCVRTPSPTFSHVSTPLVRNRRHVLKETPNYKEAFTFYSSKFPDLRDLFPHDADVFAPFNFEAKCEPGN